MWKSIDGQEAYNKKHFQIIFHVSISGCFRPENLKYILKKGKQDQILKLVVCILLRVLGQVQGFRLTQHWLEYFIQ
jgi:hypothetical protein